MSREGHMEQRLFTIFLTIFPSKHGFRYNSINSILNLISRTVGFFVSVLFLKIEVLKPLIKIYVVVNHFWQVLISFGQIEVLKIFEHQGDVDVCFELVLFWLYHRL